MSEYVNHLRHMPSLNVASFDEVPAEPTACRKSGLMRFPPITAYGIASFNLASEALFQSASL